MRQLILRVVDTVTGWGEKQNYFRDAEERDTFHAELTHLLLRAEGLLQQPGVLQCRNRAEAAVLRLLHPQGRRQHGVDPRLVPQRGDDLQRRLRLGRESVRLRSCKEKLSSGGTASGPLSFMKAADASAGVIKSGGKTRRAAKMVVLNADHPDIDEFIKCKEEEEKKAWALIDAGYDASLDGPRLQLGVFPERQQLGARHRRVHAGGAERRPMADALRQDRRGGRELPRARSDAHDRRGDACLRRPRDAVRHHHQPVAHLPGSGRINASNPCSEYMHLDNSACNLASLNLLKFIDERGEFDVKGVPPRRRRDDHRAGYRGRQLVVSDRGDRPERQAFRELGLGYANLGALLMALGMPYDSDQGRSYAAAITALMTGEAYAQSARIAEAMGPFAGYRAQPRSDAQGYRAPSQPRLQARARACAARPAARRARVVGRRAQARARRRAIATRRRP